MDMSFNIPRNAYEDIVAFAKVHSLQRVILFGSRARGTHGERSDIDIAVSGGNFIGFYWDRDEKARTLLSFDIVDLDSGIYHERESEIKRDGVIVYEKI